MTDDLRIDELSWDELQARLAGTNAVLVPIGSIEPHGRHAPLGTDLYIAEEIARRLAARTGAVRFPGLPLGTLDVIYDFRRHPGGVPLDAQLLIAVYAAVGTGLARAGFQRIVFVNAHGPNAASLAIAAYQIRDAAPAPVEVGVLEWWTVASDVVKDIKGVAYGNHADEIETSLLIPGEHGDLVHLDRVVPGPAVPDLSATQSAMYHQKVPFTRTWDRRWIGDSASMGNPERATHEAGERLLGSVVDAGVTLLDALAEELALRGGA